MCKVAMLSATQVLKTEWPPCLNQDLLILPHLVMFIIQLAQHFSERLLFCIGDTVCPCCFCKPGNLGVFLKSPDALISQRVGYSVGVLS